MTESPATDGVARELRLDVGEMLVLTLLQQVMLGRDVVAERAPETRRRKTAVRDRFADAAVDGHWSRPQDLRLPGLRPGDLDAVTSEFTAVLRAVGRKQVRWGRVAAASVVGVGLGVATAGVATPLIGAALDVAMPWQLDSAQEVDAAVEASLR